MFSEKKNSTIKIENCQQMQNKNYLHSDSKTHQTYNIMLYATSIASFAKCIEIPDLYNIE